MRTSTSYYMFVILFAATMLNLATCRTRTVYSNTWVVQVDGGQTEAERIAAEKDLTLLGQVREESLTYRLVIADVISYAGFYPLTLVSQGNSTYLQIYEACEVLFARSTRNIYFLFLSIGWKFGRFLYVQAQFTS